jgi:transposase
MVFSNMRTRLKNRVHSTLAKYALSLDTDSDIFTPKWQGPLLALVERLPTETARCVRQELELLDLVQEQIGYLEHRILERVKITPSIQLVMSLPGPAEILSIVIDREVGSIDRFSRPKHFCGYAGTVPKVKSSAGRTHYGRTIKQCNNYLKWAFIEAANVVVRQQNHPTWRNKHVVCLFNRTRQRKGHSVAVGAVARYLAETTYWVLKKGQPYREPLRTHLAGNKSVALPKQGRARG